MTGGVYIINEFVSPWLSWLQTLNELVNQCAGVAAQHVTGGGGDSSPLRRPDVRGIFYRAAEARQQQVTVIAALAVFWDVSLQLPLDVTT